MAEPNRKFTAMIAFTFTPKEEAVSASWAQARMANPVRVFVRKAQRKIKAANVTKRIRICVSVRRKLPMERSPIPMRAL